MPIFRRRQLPAFALALIGGGTAGQVEPVSDQLTESAKSVLLTEKTALTAAKVAECVDAVARLRSEWSSVDRTSQFQLMRSFSPSLKAR